MSTKKSLPNLSTVVEEDPVEFYMEIDWRARGLLGLLEEQFDLNERYARFMLAYEDIGDMDRLVDFVRGTIEDNL